MWNSAASGFDNFQLIWFTDLFGRNCVPAGGTRVCLYAAYVVKPPEDSDEIESFIEKSGSRVICQPKEVEVYAESWVLIRQHGTLCDSGTHMTKTRSSCAGHLRAYKTCFSLATRSVHTKRSKLSMLLSPFLGGFFYDMHAAGMPLIRRQIERKIPLWKVKALSHHHKMNHHNVWI